MIVVLNEETLLVRGRFPRALGTTAAAFGSGWLSWVELLGGH